MKEESRISSSSTIKPHSVSSTQGKKAPTQGSGQRSSKVWGMLCSDLSARDWTRAGNKNAISLTTVVMELRAGSYPQEAPGCGSGK